jgi:hypothetical protein
MLFSFSGTLGIHILISMHDGNKKLMLIFLVSFIIMLAVAIIYSIIIDKNADKND